MPVPAKKLLTKIVKRCEGKKKAAPGSCFNRGRYWDRTSDLFRVREARYRCANRPLHPVRPETMVFTEVGTGFEPVYTALQAAASPLGQPTV
jgi:hypothetical protein